MAGTRLGEMVGGGSEIRPKDLCRRIGDRMGVDRGRVGAYWSVHLKQRSLPLQVIKTGKQYSERGDDGALSVI